MTEKLRILIVDDEINSLTTISAILGKSGYLVETAQSGELALEKMRNQTFNLIISDYKMPGMNGEQLLKQVKKVAPNLPFILLTAFGTINKAVKAMKKGAYTYLTKPVNVEQMLGVLNDILTTDQDRSTRLDPANYYFQNIIGDTDPIKEVFSLIKRVSKTEANVLILGENGTGKELVARALHNSSHRASKPFMPIDCTTIPSQLMESELFGHEKGSFTGADELKIGLFEMAQGGTVFLDEIGDLDYELEKKLLRFLQEKEIRRVGSKKKIKLDVRVLSATNIDIEEEVSKGKFRADLYYRLNVITIHLPPLRERVEDIPLIAEHFLTHFCDKNKKDICGFDHGVIDLLKKYDWPGNVRELENIIHRAVILCSYTKISRECLPEKLNNTEGDESDGDEFNLVEMEKKIMIKALDNTFWNQSKAAIKLGISRKQLRTKMKNHDMLP
ncbi:MAG: sigma-54-dependent Fis family transcriptional regulator [Proteobacteria bacterium]|nr:sigma-54-dependent Fis family transcriptional regulator [Pseudomonadota bacterium]